jgi:hypothetical protein
VCCSHFQLIINPVQKHSHLSSPANVVGGGDESSSTLEFLVLLLLSFWPVVAVAFRFAQREMEAERSPSPCLVLWGPTYTMNPSAPWAEAVVVLDGRIAYVGSKVQLGCMHLSSSPPSSVNHWRHPTGRIERVPHSRRDGRRRVLFFVRCACGGHTRPLQQRADDVRWWRAGLCVRQGGEVSSCPGSRTRTSIRSAR